MAILSTNQRLIKIGKDYSAGSGISIDDYVISVTGEYGNVYSAGDNIDIYTQDEQLYISSRDWTQDIVDSSANSFTSAVNWVSSQGYWVGNVSTANSGSLYNINVDGLDVYGITSTSSDSQYNIDFSGYGSLYGISFRNTIQAGWFNPGTWSEWSASDTISFSSDGKGIAPWSRPIKVLYKVVYNVGQTFSGEIGEISYQHFEINTPFVKPSDFTNGGYIYVKFESEDEGSYGYLGDNSWLLSMGKVEGSTISGLIFHCDKDVNSFVYDNSAAILDTNFKYSNLSSTYLTALPQDLVTSAQLVQVVDNLSSVDGYLSGQIDSKLNTTSFSDVSSTFYTNDNPSGFITGVDLSNYYTKDETSGKEELADAFSNIPAGDSEVNSYVHNNSASIDESTNVVQSNSSVWNDITVYQSNSGNYATSSWVESKDPVLIGDSNITATSSKVGEHTQWNLYINNTPVVTDTKLTGENCITAHTTDVSGEWAVGLVQSAYEAIDSIDGISTDVQTLKSNSSYWDSKADTLVFHYVEI